MKKRNEPIKDDNEGLLPNILQNGLVDNEKRPFSIVEYTLISLLLSCQTIVVLIFICLY